MTTVEAVKEKIKTDIIYSFDVQQCEMNQPGYSDKENYQYLDYSVN